MKKNVLKYEATVFSSTAVYYRFQEFKTELIRKSIHFLIALSPTMASLSRPLTVSLLIAGTLCYATMETLRLSGVNTPMVSSIVAMASRSRDKGRFVLGPVTLGLGALLALLLYPSPVAAVSIYALAFGDGFASLVGKFLGSRRPSFLMGKSIEGSAACFGAVFLTTYRIFPDARAAFFTAFAVTLVESLPLEDYDNIAIPVSAGIVVQLALL